MRVLMLGAGLIYSCIAAARLESEDIDRIFESIQPNMPGCSMAIARHGKIWASSAAGMANVRLAEPIQHDTRFSIQSVSKQFTAASIAKLVVQNKLGLDDDIRTYLPEMPEYSKPILIRDLVFQVSGIRDYQTLIWVAGLNRDESISTREVMRLITAQRSLNRASETYQYSNSNYFLLGRIVERVAGKPLHSYVQKEFFEPLGMAVSIYPAPGKSPRFDRAKGYTASSNDVRAAPYASHPTGSSGMYSSPTDLIRWADALLNNRLGRELSALMLDPPPRSANKAGYGFGVIHGTYRGRVVIGHDGFGSGYRSEFAMLPEIGAAVAVMCNSSQLDARKFAFRLIDLGFDSELTDVSTNVHEEFEASLPNVEHPADLTNIVGTYNLEFFYPIQVSKVDQAYQLRYYNGTSTPLSYVGHRTFQTRDGDNTLTFSPTGDAVMYAWNGQLFPGHRTLEEPKESLESYVGLFQSDELDTIYRVSRNDAGLVARSQTSDREVSLRPLTIRDEFSGFNTRWLFERDQEGNVDGLFVSLRRAQGIEFKKLQ